MIDFTNIEYLKSGNEIQLNAYNLIIKSKIFDILSEFNPVLVGTIPININIESSDLDIICYWSNKDKFRQTLEQQFSAYQNFCLRETIKQERPTIICSFKTDDFPIEIFGQNIPIHEQNGYKHMIAEYFILKEKGDIFRHQIIDLKKQGVKTEPAFAQLLGINDNAYQALLEYYEKLGY
jgi:hypothetical protein